MWINIKHRRYKRMSFTLSYNSRIKLYILSWKYYRSGNTNFQQVEFDDVPMVIKKFNNGKLPF